VLALAFNRAVAPFLYWMIRKMGTPSFEIGLARMVSMPVWFLLFAALTGGVVEEVLFRGYVIERLQSITGNYCLAGLISTTVVALLHLPMWGWGPVATFFVSGAVLTVFYIFTRDLAACMIVHTITDAVGFITAYKALHCL
jgi:membrane protease YdiL (CAAX protease family)